MAEYLLNILTNYWFWGSAGFIIGCVLSIRNMLKNDCSFPAAVVSITVGIYFGMLGTRILWILLLNPALFFEDFVLAIAFWQQTGTWLAAAPAGGLGIAIVLWIAKKPIWSNLGSAAPGLALAHAIARIGCLCAGCCYGKPTQVPWAIYSEKLNTLVHPTQIYSIAGEVVSLLVLQWVWRKSEYRKFLFPMYVFFLSIHRFINGFFRGDYPGPEIFPGLRIYQTICIFLFVISLALIMGLKWKKKGAVFGAVLITITIFSAIILKPISEQELRTIRKNSGLYLVATRDCFVSELEQWKSLRSQQGFEVVIKGWRNAPSEQMVKNWIRDKVGSSGGVSSYILIAGDCSNKKDSKAKWHIPSVRQKFEANGDERMIFFADSLYGDLNNDGCPDVPVGRLPIRSRGELAKQISKIIEYEHQRPRANWHRAVIWTGAKGYASVIEKIRGKMVGLFPDWIETYMISGDTSSPYSGYPPEQPGVFLEQFKEPAMFSVIASHGSFRSVTPTIYNDKDIFLCVDDLGGVSSRKVGGILFLVGCDSGRFYTSESQGPCLAESFAGLEGGPIAVVASVEATNPLTNYFICRQMVHQLKSKPKTIGDLLLSIQRGLYQKGRGTLLQLAQGDASAKAMLQAIPEEEKRSLRINSLIRNELVRYNLLGDPSCSLKLPKKISLSVSRKDDGRICVTGQTAEKSGELFIEAFQADDANSFVNPDTTIEKRRSIFKKFNQPARTIYKGNLRDKKWDITISPAMIQSHDDYLRFIVIGKEDDYIATYNLNP